MSDRFAEVLSDLASLYKSGQGGTPEQKAKLFDQIGAILQRSFTSEERARVAGDPPPMPYQQTTWIESVA